MESTERPECVEGQNREVRLEITRGTTSGLVGVRGTSGGQVLLYGVVGTCGHEGFGLTTPRRN